MSKKRIHPSIWLILLVLLTFPMSAQQGTLREEGRSVGKVLELAHAQHEIVMLFIKDGQFNKALEATEELLSLPFPPEQEQNLIKSITLITEQLFVKGRVDLSHQILEKACRVIHSPANQGDLYLIQARLYKKQGLNYKAIEAYRKYQAMVGQQAK